MKTPSCSFCQKTYEQVTLLIATPNGEQPKAFICEACVAVCVRLVTDHIAAKPEAGEQPEGKGGL